MLTTTEASQRLRVGRRHIAHLIRTGQLKAVKKGRDWLVDEAEVDRYDGLDRKPGPKGPRTKE